MKNEYISTSTGNTEDIGRELAAELEMRNFKNIFIAMHGEMGVGKTAFVRGFSSHFGIAGVKSPTYTIVNEYRGRTRIFHFDMYRIESDDDLLSIGYDDYIKADGICIAEWCENIEDMLPENIISVTISRINGNDDSRKITVELPYKDKELK